MIIIIVYVQTTIIYIHQQKFFFSSFNLHKHILTNCGKINNGKQESYTHTRMTQNSTNRLDIFFTKRQTHLFFFNNFLSN